MNVRFKTMLVVLGTLIVGALIGSLITGTVADNRIQRLHKLRTPAGFVERMEEIIQPVDQDQREQIRYVLTQHADRVTEIDKSCWARRDSAVTDMRAALVPLLNAEQKTRLAEWYREYRVRIEQKKQEAEKSQLSNPKQ